MNTWNNKVGRWINRGSKAIKVISEDIKNVRYLFDISDTHGELTTRITNYTIKSEDAQRFVIDYVGGADNKNFAGFIDYLCMDLLQNSVINDEGIENFIHESTTYSILSRLDLATEESYDFDNALYQIDINQAIEYATIISGISEQVLRLIEKPARIYEQKEREYYESGIHRRNRNGGVSGNERGIGSSEDERNEKFESKASFRSGLPGRSGRDSISEDSNRSERGFGTTTDGIVHISSDKIYDRE